MIDYQIAIPTYGRPDAIRKYTLNYLENSDVDRERVTLFVANSEEKEKYESSNPGYNIVVGVKGLCPQRAFINSYYPRGTRVWSFDDDVSGVETIQLLEKLDSNQKPLDHPCRLVPVDSLDRFIQRGFRLAETYEVGLWGCYAVRNKGFLHPKINVGLKFVMGHGFGFYAGDPAFKEIESYQMKDDFYLSLWHFENANGTLVFNDHCIKSKAHSGSGGTNADMERKLNINNETVDKIVERFPELASVKMRRTKDEWLSRYKELRLKNAVTDCVSTLSIWNADFE
jgi:hypothetical protein